MKKNNKIKYIVYCVIALLILVFIILIYNNLFADSKVNRYEGIEKYNLTNNEKNAVSDSFNLDSIDSVKVYKNNRIINIILNLKEDVDFNIIKDLANKSLEKFSKKNLSYYDIEIYVKSNKESEVYPKIGYKFKASNEFAW